MLELKIVITPEQWDEKNEEFIPAEVETIQLEHSLASLSKWESKWCKPFLHSDKTTEEIMDYIKCMTLTQNVNPIIYENLTRYHIDQINEYIAAPMTATTFPDNGKYKKNREIITAELLYYQMAANGIWLECENWHLTKLTTLLRVCGIKNTPPDKKNKRSQKDLAAHYAALNQQRRAKYNSKG